MTVLPFWALLPIALRFVTAFPPQEPLLPTDSTPVASSGDSSNLPLVIWHGLGDNYKAEGLQSIGELLNDTIGNTTTYYIRLDDDPSADRTATFLGNVTLQVQKVCDDLASHPILSKAPAIDALGFSQGGQFLRAYVERCNNPRVENLVTFGSQHNGISEFQECVANDWLCQTWRGVLKGNAWGSFSQGRLVPAQYYRDPEDLDNYLEYSNLLADINNERKVKNDTYNQNMKKLGKFAMYMFAEDTTVVPKESAFFSEVNTTSEEVKRLQERDIYQEDWIGLRFLDEERRLEFKIAEGGHMQLSNNILTDAFNEYFKSQSKGGFD
ncbi:MAG: hypothetical protein ALECFALPRED_009815 [Alectoria fallacina]|uniref:Palmitoyl-protein thioesterase 1 n=1 Tax=Alectoria fallacina TaxID=1903189 RepID=A0A8H3J8Q9_9LECA|nr:MAG: hypothetical protein ALECFALPRED_009815 [Alectoria fallacina]